MKDNVERTLDILTKQGYRSVSDLAAELGVSEMTARRYLDKLVERGLITRTYGGAYLGHQMIEIDYRARETVRQEEKSAIGRAAFSMIQAGESVYIDAGTTCAALADAIDDSRRITVVSNSMVVMQTLERRKNVATICIGGAMHAASHSFVGPLAEESVRQFRFARAFLGANGIDSHGFTQANFDEVPIKKQVAASSREVIILADSHKFGADTLVLFLRVEQASAIITDPGIPDGIRRELEDRGVRIIIAEPRGAR